jgi:hypothetical protein
VAVQLLIAFAVLPLVAVASLLVKATAVLLLVAAEQGPPRSVHRTKAL